MVPKLVSMCKCIYKQTIDLSVIFSMKIYIQFKPYKFMISKKSITVFFVFVSTYLFILLFLTMCCHLSNFSCCFFFVDAIYAHQSLLNIYIYIFLSFKISLKSTQFCLNIIKKIVYLFIYIVNQRNFNCI